MISDRSIQQQQQQQHQSEQQKHQQQQQQQQSQSHQHQHSHHQQSQQHQQQQQQLLHSVSAVDSMNQLQAARQVQQLQQVSASSQQQQITNIDDFFLRAGVPASQNNPASNSVTPGAAFAQTAHHQIRNRNGNPLDPIMNASIGRVRNPGVMATDVTSIPHNGNKVWKDKAGLN
ncbi:uncharacterized protein RJT20DRAFT_123822 [Scheffersomyces xylosifermentans]|uniref:uncharacterized protein n=1 Tax=Scheffersomyces xylosifermentans TaxID=1304137 RepID=UPI00315D31ED